MVRKWSIMNNNGREVCETFIEWDGIVSMLWTQIKNWRNREYKIELDSTVLSSKKTNLVYNSIAACVYHSDRDLIPDGQTSYVRCLTCNACFCGLCGKALNYARIHTDGLETRIRKKDNSKNGRVALKPLCNDTAVIRIKDTRNYIIEQKEFWLRLSLDSKLLVRSTIWIL